MLYALMDFVIDQYLPIVQQIEDEVQEIEEDDFRRQPQQRVPPRASTG